MLFWAGGQLYREPVDQDRPGRSFTMAEFWPFELLEERGDWLRVKPAESPCFDNPLSDFEVELWLPREQLHPVLRRRVELGAPDGSGHVLLPGVAVDPVQGQVHTRSFSASVTLDPTELGLSYLPAEPLERPSLHSHLVGEELGHSALGSLLSRLPAARVYGSFGEDGRILRDACSEHRIHSALPVEESPPLDESPPSSLPSARAPSGAEVLFEDGTVAGQLRAERRLGPRLSSASGLWCEAFAGLALCFRESELELPSQPTRDGSTVHP